MDVHSDRSEAVYEVLASCVCSWISCGDKKSFVWGLILPILRAPTHLASPSLLPLLPSSCSPCFLQLNPPSEMPLCAVNRHEAGALVAGEATQTNGPL